MPLMPPRSTERLMMNLDDNVYTGTPSTIMYKLVDAICGSTGAGKLINQAFLTTLQNDLNTTYGSDLDYYMGNIGFLPRSPAESYPYDTATDMLTSEQWDEVRIADAWYRARIQDFWAAVNLGGTPEGMRMAIQSALSCDCTIYEAWRYIDNFGLTGSRIGRAPYGSGARNEVVIQPHKTNISPQEMRLARDMLDRIASVDTIITIDPNGLSTLVPVPTASATADSTYYEVQKEYLASPAISQLPPPEKLPIDLSPTEAWLYNAKDNPVLAPYANLNITAQFGYYYTIGGGQNSPIDSVTYGTLQVDGSVKAEPNFVAHRSESHFTEWKNWETADSPDNYPGGKFGQHPSYAPALNADGSPYTFPWASQAAYVAAQSAIVIAQGGNANTVQYQLPISGSDQTQIVFYPQYAVAYFPPGKDSTVSASLTAQRPVRMTGVWTNPDTFIRS